jgi:hypothetical protein
MPWSKMLDYKDKLKDHFDEIMDRINMVSDKDMTQQAAEKRNKASMIKFHEYFTRFLTENNIKPQ